MVKWVLRECWEKRVRRAAGVNLVVMEEQDQKDPEVEQANMVLLVYLE